MVRNTKAGIDVLDLKSLPLRDAVREFAHERGLGSSSSWRADLKKWRFLIYLSVADSRRAELIVDVEEDGSRALIQRGDVRDITARTPLGILRVLRKLVP